MKTLACVANSSCQSGIKLILTPNLVVIWDFVQKDITIYPKITSTGSVTKAATC